MDDSDRMRLAIVLPCLARGGMEESMRRVLSRLPRDRYTPVVVAFETSSGKKPPLGEGDFADCPVHVAGRKRSEGIDLGLFRRLARIFTRERIDVVHTHNWASALYGIVAARMAGVRWVVHSERGVDTLEPPRARRRVVAHVTRPMVDVFAAVSHDLARRLEATWGIEASEVKLLPNGLDLDRFDGAAADRRTVRARLEASEDAFLVGSMTMFRPIKDLPTMIRGIARAHADDPRIRLVLIGAYGAHPEIQRVIAQVPPAAVQLLPHQSDAPTLLAGFDAYLNTSLYEGCSMSILEAMAAKLPVVATAVGGTPELIDHGEEGMLVPPSDPNAVAEAVRALARDRARAARIGAQARARVEARHQSAAAVARYDALYQGLRQMEGGLAAAGHRATKAWALGAARALASRPPSD